MTAPVSIIGCDYCGQYLSPIPIGLQGGHTHGASVEERSQLPDDRITSDLHSAGSKDSNTRDQRGREDRGPDVQRHSEAAPEHTFDDGRGGGAADDLIRSGGSRVLEPGIDALGKRVIWRASDSELSARR